MYKNKHRTGLRTSSYIKLLICVCVHTHTRVCILTHTHVCIYAHTCVCVIKHELVVVVSCSKLQHRHKSAHFLGQSVNTRRELCIAALAPALSPQQAVYCRPKADQCQDPTHFHAFSLMPTATGLGPEAYHTTGLGKKNLLRR